MEYPLLYKWVKDDGVFAVARRSYAEACKRYEDGKVYLLGAEDERNMAQHRGYFARVNEAFKSLPEYWGDFFKSPEHLRKWCLIQEGYCSQDTFAFATAAEALRFARYAKKGDQDFTVVEASGASVVIYTAESQRVYRNGKGMRAERFKASIRAVEQRLDGILGLKPGTVSKQRESA